MLQKQPSRKGVTLLGRGVAIFAGIELLSFVGSYIGYLKLNRDQEFRYWVSQKFPALLEGYYKTGEFLGDPGTRLFDQQTWSDRKK